MPLTERERFRRAQEQARHQVLLLGFKHLDRPGDRWMCRTSENDPDVIIEITRRPREPFSVYCFDSDERWIFLGCSKIAGLFGAAYQEIPYDELESVAPGEKATEIVVNGSRFWAPEELRSKFLKLLALMLNHAPSGQAPTAH
jgi:hypothetical protein